MCYQSNTQRTTTYRHVQSKVAEGNRTNNSASYGVTNIVTRHQFTNWLSYTDLNRNDII